MPKNYTIFCLQPLLLVFLMLSSNCGGDRSLKDDYQSSVSDQHVLVLGIAQDAGYPQSGCMKACCMAHYDGKLPAEKVCSIAIIDRQNQTYWVVDATPDFKSQLHLLNTKYPDYTMGGIFLTHAHMGHYTGLMHLGREAMGASKIPVYAMPRMASFLRENGPWSQLVQLENISIQEITPDENLKLNQAITVVPFLVPHRDEYSETVGYQIMGPSKNLMFLPDIDKWNKWERSIVNEIKEMNYALLDGSFFKNGEIKGRDMSLIPHPFIEESIALFNDLMPSEKSKINFIHLNHTNPLIDPNSDESKQVIEMGFAIARESNIYDL